MWACLLVREYHHWFVLSLLASQQQSEVGLLWRFVWSHLQQCTREQRGRRGGREWRGERERERERGRERGGRGEREKLQGGGGYTCTFWYGYGIQLSVELMYLYVSALTCIYFPCLEFIASSKAAKKVHVHVHPYTCIYKFLFHSYVLIYRASAKIQVCFSIYIVYAHHLYLVYLCCRGLYWKHCVQIKLCWWVEQLRPCGLAVKAPV